MPTVSVADRHRQTNQITFRDVAALARQRGWTVQHLAERFRGRIEQPAEFFLRVLNGKTPDVFIPYRSVIEFYRRPQQTPLPFGDCLMPRSGADRSI